MSEYSGVAQVIKSMSRYDYQMRMDDDLTLLFDIFSPVQYRLQNLPNLFSIPTN